MYRSVKQYRRATALFALSATASVIAAAGCGDEFSNCFESRTCPRSNVNEGGAAGAEGDAGGEAGTRTPNLGGAVTADAGATSAGVGGDTDTSGTGGAAEAPSSGGESADGGAGPIRGDEPPTGAFAWYKATKDDVTVINAFLRDGNDFIKGAWAKTSVTAEALQADVDGGNGATALYSMSSSYSTLKHPIDNSSALAPKTLRIRAKKGLSQYITLGGPANPAGLAPLARFDLLNGVVVENYAASATMTAIKDLWYECEATFEGGNEFWLGVSSPFGVTPGATTPAVWVQNASVEQSIVTTWLDRIGTNHFKDAKGSWRWLSSSPEHNGGPAIEAGSQYSASLTAGLAADWQFLHDGSGGAMVISHHLKTAGKFDGRLLGTEYLGEQQGTWMGLAAADRTLWEYGVSNEAGDKVFSITGGTTSGTHWLVGSFSTSSTPNAQLFQDGILVGASAAVSPPTAKPAALTLRLGDSESSPSALISEVIVYKRALATADVDQLKLYFGDRLPK